MKKYLLVIFLLVLYCAARSQVFQTNNSPFKFRGLKADSMLVIPSGADTANLANPKWGESMNGALFYKSTDSTLWAKYGVRWVKINRADLADFIRNLGTYENKVFNIESGTTNEFTTNSLSLLNLVNKYDTISYKPVVINITTGDVEQLAYWPTGSGGGAYVDTIYRKAGQDSIFYTINGGTEMAVKDSIGAGGSGSTEYVVSGLGIRVDSSGRVYTVNSDTANLSVISRQRAAAQYAALNSHNFFTTQNNFQSIYANKDSIPYSTGIGTVLIYDSVTSQFKKQNLGGIYWGTTGNVGTSSSTNWIGTTDNVDFVIRRNGAVQATFRNSSVTLPAISTTSVGGIGTLTLQGSGGSPENVKISGNNINIPTNSTHLGISQSYAISSGTGIYRSIHAYPIWNQTGGTGTLIGVDYNPTVTSVTGNHYGMLIRAGSVGIGTATPAASALLDLTSTTQGALLPLMNTTQQNAISSPATGLMIWNTDSLSLFQYTGSAWQNVRASGGATGITSLNGLTGATQTFATGTSGTDFNISSSGTIHTLNFPNASASNRGLLTSADWTTFNNKQNSIDTLTGTLLADVTMTIVNTWYSGPSVTLPVGTWQVIGNITVSGSTTGYGDCRLYDGSTGVGAGNYQIIAGRSSSAAAIAMVIVSSGTTSVTLQGHNNVTGGVIRAASVLTTQPGATRIIATKIK